MSDALFVRVLRVSAVEIESTFNRRLHRRVGRQPIHGKVQVFAVNMFASQPTTQAPSGFLSSVVRLYRMALRRPSISSILLASAERNRFFIVSFPCQFVRLMNSRRSRLIHEKEVKC